MFVSASELRAAGWCGGVPAWIAGSMIFWLWTPRFLLHREISLRSLLPGALLATFVLGGTVGTSPLWIGPTLNQNGNAFGSFGVVIGLFAYILIVVTISMVCAVFAPVWAEWRQGESERKSPGSSGLGRTRHGTQSVASGYTVWRRSCGPTPPGASGAGRDGGRSCSDGGGAQHRPRHVESALKDLGGRRRWLAPLVFAAGTVAVVFDGVLLLLRNWRLTLLQLFPAVWISVMAWNMKNHLLSKPTFSMSEVIPVAVGVLLAAQIAYWCNGTFAYTMAQDATGDIRAAFGEARRHWHLIGGLALLTGGAQAAIWLLMPHLTADWLWLALFVMFVVQIYLFVAIPCWLLGARKTGTRRERTTQSVTTGVLSGVASMPGFLLNRIGWLLLGSGPSGSSAARCWRSEPCCTSPRARRCGSSSCRSAFARRNPHEAQDRAEPNFVPELVPISAHNPTLGRFWDPSRISSKTADKPADAGAQLARG